MAGACIILAPWYYAVMLKIQKAVKLFGSREALAHELGVSGQTVWRWERGDQMPLIAQRLLERVLDERKAKARDGA